MFRQFIVLLFFCCFCFSNQVHAQDSGLIYKVTDPKTNVVSYLFGTNHSFGKSFFDSLDHFSEALDNCTIVYVESLRLPGQDSKDLINKRTKLTPWKKFLKKEDLNYLQRLFQNSDTDFQKITPTELHVFLYRYYNSKVCENRNSKDPQQSLDEYIAELATAKNKKLVALETVAEQLEIIRKDVEGMPRKVHKKRLRYILEKIRSKNPSDCEKSDKYASQNWDLELDKACNNTLVLTDRNNKWLMEIIPSMQDNPCFVAVGLSHLMYTCGLVSQLREKGFKVEAFTNED